MAVGDINSTEKGSGARYNDGKTPFHLIPAANLLRFWRGTFEEIDDGYVACHALKCLDFLERGQPLLFRQSLYHLSPAVGEAARVFEYGRKKYAAWNWAKGMPWSVPAASLKRHIEAMVDGDRYDEESGLRHVGHIVCNIIMLDHYIDYYPEGNDFPVFAEKQTITPLSVPEDIGDNQWADGKDYHDYLNVRAGRDDCDGI